MNVEIPDHDPDYPHRPRPAPGTHEGVTQPKAPAKSLAREAEQQASLTDLTAPNFTTEDERNDITLENCQKAIDEFTKRSVPLQFFAFTEFSGGSAQSPRDMVAISAGAAQEWAREGADSPYYEGLSLERSRPATAQDLFDYAKQEECPTMHDMVELFVDYHKAAEQTKARAAARMSR